MQARKHTILPLIGTDQLKLGSTRASVRQEYADLYCGSFQRDDHHNIDDYGWFHAYFVNEVLCAVEFFEPCEVYWGEVQLIGLEFAVCKELFLQSDDTLRLEGDVGFSSPKLQIGVYAPYGSIETVLIAKDGYYQ